MKVSQLLESGTLKNGWYNFGNHPTANDRQLAHFYNNVIPALSRIFKIPANSFKAGSAFGSRSSTLSDVFYTRSTPWSLENVAMRVTVRRKRSDMDLVIKLLPKALKAELSKQLVDVTVDEPEVKVMDAGVKQNYPHEGATGPILIYLRFGAKSPPEWDEWDKQRYGRRIP
jgi:hypothetical protein